MGQAQSANFEFLKKRSAQLHRLAMLAELYFTGDPNTCLLKLRQFGEALAQEVAARGGVAIGPADQQVDVLRRLTLGGLLPRQPADLFHHIRRLGNSANHEFEGTHGDALSCMKMARELAVWFHRSFAAPDFRPGTNPPKRYSRASVTNANMRNCPRERKRLAHD